MAVLAADIIHDPTPTPILRGPAAKPFSTSDTVTVAPILPDDAVEWKAYLDSNCARCVSMTPQGRSSVPRASVTIFHTMAWRDAVCAAFPHEPIYLAARRGGAGPICGVLPLFLVKSALGGRMLVSVPYGVGGGVTADDDEVSAALLDAAKNVATQRRCRSLELRNEVASVPDVPILGGYVGFRRELPSRVEDVPAWLPRKARAAARNARDRFRLSVEFSGVHLRTVWRLYASNMRRLGSICYPFRFFGALHDALDGNDPNRAEASHSVLVSLVRHREEPVAGLVSFVFGDCIMPYFYGSSARAQRCSAANFAYFTLAEWAIAHGLRTFDFGRTRIDNLGSYDFKRFHGFEPHPLEYQRITLGDHRAVDLSPRNPAFSLARRAWPHLPLWTTKMAGAWLSRQITG